jgi:hypothetical protein
VCERERAEGPGRDGEKKIFFYLTLLNHTHLSQQVKVKVVSLLVRRHGSGGNRQN